MSQRGRAVDVPIAYVTKAGLRPGIWMERQKTIKHCMGFFRCISAVASKTGQSHQIASASSFRKGRVTVTKGMKGDLLLLELSSLLLRLILMTIDADHQTGEDHPHQKAEGNSQIQTLQIHRNQLRETERVTQSLLHHLTQQRLQK